MRTIIPQSAKVIPENATRVFKGIIFDVYHWEQKMFDGSMKTFEMLKRPDSVHTLAIKDDKIVILEEEQPHQGRFYSLPGGRHDKEEESELEAAQRELFEETGMRFKHWKLLSISQPHRNIDWFMYTFSADGFIEQKEQDLDSGEKVRVLFKPLEEVKELMKTPQARHLGKHILEHVHSIEELRQHPAYAGN